MSLPVFTHAAMLRHQTGAGHPERPQRLTAVLDALADADLDLQMREAPRAPRAALERVHPQSYVDAVFGAEPRDGLNFLDPDTAMGPGSLEAGLRAAGAVIAAVQGVAEGRFDRSFCAVRPPGHHAEADRAMGFCLFSSVAAGVREAQSLGMQRVAVVDFDVHHGNGTQAIFEHDPSVFVGSIHQYPLYPGTGAEAERGVGNIVNVTTQPGAARSVWRERFERRLMPEVDAFAPDLIIVSAGFDAHRRDPLAQQELEAEDFAWATRAILDVARGRTRGRVVSSLEGGYDLEGLGRSAAAHVRALQEG